MWEFAALEVEILRGNRHSRPSIRQFPHLAKTWPDTPNLLHAALDMTACAPFMKERRMEIAELTKLHRKFGDMGHPRSRSGKMQVFDPTPLS
jgi:hypothetical protein